RSAEAIAALRPNVIASGHGVPMHGERMQDELDELAKYFDQLAVPTHGRYVNRPAIMNEQGVVSLPEPVTTPATRTLITAGLITAAGLAALALTRWKKNKNGSSPESPLKKRPYYGEEMNLSVYGEIPEVEDNELLRKNGPQQKFGYKNKASDKEDFTGRNAPSNNYP